MTNNDSIATSGENRLKDRRRKLIRFVAVACVGFAVLGYATGYMSGSYREDSLPAWIPITILVFAIPAIAWFTWSYFRRVDELEIMDNLWSHLIGQYVAILSFMGWYFLAEFKVVTYPSAFAIVAIMIVATLLAYLGRKAGLR